MPVVQEYIKEKIVTELKNKLNTDLGIESLYFKPFSTLQLNGVYLNDRSDAAILRADKVYAGFDLLPLMNNQLIITDARLSDFEVFLFKDSANASLNIQFVIDAFKPKQGGTDKKLDIKINSLNIDDGNFYFDVNNRPVETAKFDPNHISVSNLNAKLSLKSLQGDSLNIQIKKLELEEKSGFKIDNLIARFITQDQHLSVKGFRLDLPNSLLQFDNFEIDYSVFRVPADLLSYATFETKISSSYIVLSDITAFVPAFEHFKDRILFRTDISGKIDSIQVKEIALDYGEKMHLSAKGFVNNIRNKDRTFISGNISDLMITEEGVIGILNNLSKEKKETPPILAHLGTVTFRGNVLGFLKNMKAEGILGSQLGSVHANATIGINPDVHHSLFFDGKVETDDFKLGQLLGNPQIGDISFDLIASIAKPVQGDIKGTAEGIIHSLTFKNYTYHDIQINGKYDGAKIEGGLSLDDPNAIFNINGLFDLSGEEPLLNFDAKLKNVRFDRLNLTDKYKESYLSADIDANFVGKNIDNANGYLEIDSLLFLHEQKRFEMKSFRIEASGEAANRSLMIQSDLINGKITGEYSFTTIVESLRRTLHCYLPSLINYQENNRKTIKENDIEFDFTVNNTENASDVFKLPVTIYSPTKIVGFYDNNLEKFKVETFLPSILAGGMKIQSGYLILENTDTEIKSTVSGAFVTKNGTINDLSINLDAQNDLINIHTLFLNKDHDRLKAELYNSVLFSRTGNNLLQTDINFQPGDLVLNNTLWQIKESRISLTNGDVSVNNFEISSSTKDQRLAIDGNFSTKSETDRLNISLRNIDLDYIFTTLAIDALQFGGSTNGSLYISSIQGNPYADVNLNVTDFSFNKTNLGTLELDSDLDTENLRINMTGLLTNENGKKTDISGYIHPVTQELSLNFDAEEVNVAFLNKYVETLFNGVKGRGKGNVHLFGDFSNVTVEGVAYIENGGIGVNFLNTNYTFTDTIYMNKDLIYFKDVSFYDEKGNIAKVTGRVVHDFFTNFMYYVDLSGENFLLYNATEKLNPMFYGTVYGSGSGVIKGDEQVVDINMNLRTDRNTNVYMNFMEETATEYSFVTFKTPENENDSISNGNGINRLNRLRTDSGIEMNLNFYVDATPDATVELLMDPVGGDRLRGSGSGALQFVWGSNKDPMLYGTYNVTSGSYNFTFQKILERKFMIQEGSSVQFRGDPFQANIDITAIYRVIANLNDLDRNLAMSAGQSSVPVNCLLHITGMLRSPSVSLDIELPSADPEIQRQVKSLMSTEDMINRQIVFLLLMSKFYTPSYAQTDRTTSDFAAIASATLSTQLSKILGGILDDRWQVGTNIRTRDTDFSNPEFELMLSSRLLNDRVLFNGNFGYRDNIDQPDAYISDIDIEVLLNRMGTWRLKAYNHYNEKFYYVRNAVQTQGVGIVYKKDFDNLRELFGRPQKQRIRPISSPPEIILPPDTTSRTDTIPSISQFVIMKK